MALLINDINLDRQDLAAFLPDLRSIKAFENLAKAVSTAIPAAVNSNTDSIDQSNVAVAYATELAAAAQGSADTVARALDRLTEAVMTQRDHRATIVQMQRQIDELRTILLGS